MKKALSLLLALCMVFALAACGSAPAPAPKEEPAPAEDPVPAEEPASAEEVELIVFAAASMTETLSEIKGLYEAANPGVTVTCNFDSSGTLKTQIQEGAECDVFISAAPKQMNALDAACDAEKNPDGLDFVLQGSRINLLENKVALVVPEGNPKGVESFDRLAELLKAGDVFLAMGNSDVPVGSPTAPTSRRSPPRSRRAAWTAAWSTAPTPSPPVWKWWIPPAPRCAARSSTRPPS